MEADKRINWIEARLSFSLKQFSNDLNSQINTKKNRILLNAFLKRSSRRILSISSSSDGDVSLSNNTTHRSVVISHYFIKYPHINTVQSNHVSQSLISTDISIPISIQDIDWLILNIFIPRILDCSSNKLVLSIKDVFDISRGFRNRIAGEVSLPSLVIPKQFRELTSDISPLLEDIASSWLSRIKKAIATQLEEQLYFDDSNQTSLGEIRSLKQKVKKFSQINNLLKSEHFLYVYNNLIKSKSWLVRKIDDVIKNIEQILFESEDLLVYLSPLEKWVNTCCDTPPHLRHNYIHPIFKLIYLIWDQCPFYRVQSNFNRLIASFINFIVEIVRERLPDDLFSVPSRSIEEIQSALHLCYAFQGSYIDAKINSDRCLDKSREINLLEFDALPEALRSKYEFDKISKTLPCQWPARKDRIYQTFSKTVNRLQDLLEIIKSISDFEDIREIIQKGDNFSETFNEYLDEIFSKFMSSLRPILEIESSLFVVTQNEKFEHIFFAFRSGIKELEHRIISTLKSYLSSSCDILNLRRMQLFGKLLSRPMIHISLKEFFMELINNLGTHIEQIGSLVSEFNNCQGFHHFIPTPISKFLYLRALSARLDYPYKLIMQISPNLFDVPTSGIVSKKYLDILSSLEQLLTNFRFIETDIPEDFSLHLHKPVLIASGKSHTPIPSLQSHVIHLMYIAVYLRKLEFHPSVLPPSLHILLEQYSNLQLAPQLSKLFYTVHKFNKIWNNRNSPIHRLFQQRISDCRQLIERGLTEVTWNSFVLKDFLQQLVTAVFTNLEPILKQTEHNLNSIKNIIHSWCSQPSNLFCSVPNSPVLPLTELSKRIKANNIDYDISLVRSREKINQLLIKLSSSVSINMHCAQWKQFLQYIDQLLYRGITSQTSKSFSAVQMYLAPIDGASENTHTVNGLFSVNFRLLGDSVAFSPFPYPEGQTPSLVEQIKSWVMGVYTRNNDLHPFYHPKGAFIEYLKNETFFSNLISDFDYILLDDLNNSHVVLQKFSQYSFLWTNDCNSYFRNFISPRNESPNINSSYSPDMELPTIDSSHLDQASLNNTRLNEFAFLYPNLFARTQGSYSKGKLPLLEDFEKEILLYYSLKQELLKIPQHIRMGCIVIDARGIRSFLLSLCANWLFTFCDYLQDKVILVLEDLNFLFEKVEPELSKICTQTADLSQLMKNMRIFHTIRNKQTEIQQKFSTLQRANSILERFEFTLRQDIREFYLSTPRKLDHLNSVFEMAKQKIRPCITSNKQIIIEKLHTFQQELANISNQFYRSYLFNSDCPSKDARELLDEYAHKFSDLKDKSKDIAELQSFLETQFVNFTSLQKLLDTFITIRKVWMLVNEVTHTTKQMKRDMWKKQVPEEILQKVGELKEKVDKIPQEAMQWDITVSMKDYLEELKSTVPLLTLLQSPSIRESHWKLILKLSPKPRVGSAALTDVSILTKLSFGKLIDLGLHHCFQQIETIVEKSKTEVTSESILNNFKEFWDGFLFSLEDYIRPLAQSISGVVSEPSLCSSQSSNENLLQSMSGTLRRPSKGVITSSKMSGINSVGFDAPVMEPIPTLSNVNEVFDSLESHMIELESVLNSASSLPFQDDLKPWQHKLQRVKTILKLWVEIQDNWIQADKFFSWNDVRQNLTQEVIGFVVVDKQWRFLMKEVQTDPHVMRTCCKEGRLRFLEEINQSLEQTRVAIYKYYENFKALYPRFYFISSYYIHTFISHFTDLKILSQHMHMLFPGIFDLSLRAVVKSKSTITGVVAFSGGRLQLNTPVVCDNHDKVTSLLHEFSSNLHDTLKDYFGSSIDKISQETPLNQLEISQIGYFLLSELNKAKSSEIFLLVTRVLSSTLIQRLVNQNDVSQLKCTQSGIQKLIILLSRYLHSGHLGSLDLMQRDDAALDNGNQENSEEIPFQSEPIPITTYLLIQNFLMSLFYFKELVESLISINCDTKLADSIEWQSSIKHIMPSDDTLSCNLLIHEHSVPYVFEFQGDFKEIILFPNTNRCYSHLLQSLSTNFGGLLVGKQGSGKMSTIKQFAYLLGRPLFVYSCTSNTSFEYLKDFTYGANNSRSLVCFRCIDNIHQQILSVFIELIRALFTGSVHNKIGVPFQQPFTPLDLNHGAVLATAQYKGNACSNYSLFTNVFKSCMLLPNIPVITEVLLYTAGFQNSRELAARLNTFYEYYDILVGSSNSKYLSHFSIFKLRHLLILASNKLSNELINSAEDNVSLFRRHSGHPSASDNESEVDQLTIQSASSQGQTSETTNGKNEEGDIKNLEIGIIYSSLVDYLPHLTSFLPNSQIAKLQNIVQTLFSSESTGNPNDLTDSSQHELSTQNESLLRVLKRFMLEPDDQCISKIGEVWNSLKLHHMVFLLGPSSSGKTTAINVCCSLFKDLGHSATVHTILPQALHKDKLFGAFNLQEKTWTKGLLPHFLDNCFVPEEKLHTSNHYWFHLDGTLDRLHSDVFSTFDFEDYSICLPTKQQMLLLPNTRIILESDSSDFLTPSLLAKLRIISFNSTVSWNTIIHSWIDTQNENDSVEWQFIFDNYLPTIMTSLFQNTRDPNEHTLRKLSTNTRKVLNKTQFRFAVELNKVSVIYSLISLLKSLISSFPNPQKDFKEVLFNFAAVWAIGGSLDDHSRIFFDTIWHELFQGPNSFPQGSNIWSYIPNYETQSLTKPRIIPFTYSKERLFEQMPFITDPETETILTLLDYLSVNNIPILITGDVGSGKTLLVNHFSNRMDSSDFDLKYTKKFKCNSLSSSHNLWNMLKSELVWSTNKSIYVPRGNMKLHNLIEDIHLVDVPGQQSNSVAEMLRWISSNNELFDFNTYAKKNIELVNFIVTCNPRLTNLSCRFTKHFFIHHYQYPTFNSQVSIFGQLLGCMFNCTHPTSINQTFIQSIVSLTVELQSSLKRVFVQTQERSLYLFTLRDISNIFRSLCLILEPNCPVREFVQLWNHEVCWSYEQKLVNYNDTLLFRQLKTRLIHKYFDSGVLKDYLTQPNEHFSFIENINEHRLSNPLSLLSEYKVIADQQKLTSTMDKPSVKQAAKDWLVTPFTLDLLNRISLHLIKPPDISNLIIIGESQILCTISLIASIFNFTLERISYHLASHSEETKSSEEHCTFFRSSEYDLNVFDNYMRNLYTRAGIHMEKIILLFDYRELKSKNFFLRILEFVEECQISPLFSLEQRGNIVNGLRTHISKLSLVFSEALAWKIFMDNIYRNLTIIINFKELDINFYQLIHSVPSLFNRLSCILCSRWDRTQLGILCENALLQCSPKHINLTPYTQNLIVELLPLLFSDFCKNLKYNQNYIPGNDSFTKFIIKFSSCFGSIFGEILSQRKIIKYALEILESIQKSKESFELEFPNREFVYNDKKASCSDFLKLIGQQGLNISESTTCLQRLEQNIDFLDKIQPKLNDALQLAILESNNKIGVITQTAKKFDSDTIMWLRTNSNLPELSSLLTVFISLFRSSHDTQPLIRVIRRLLSNSDRFLSQIIDFHTTTEISEETVLGIRDILSQDLSGTADTKAGKELYNTIQTITDWLSAISAYYHVKLHKVNPIQERIRCNIESVNKLKNLKEVLKAKIISVNETRRNLHQSLIQSSLSLTQYVGSYDEQSADFHARCSLIEDLSELPDKWQEYSQISEEVVTTILITTAISQAYISFLASFPIEDQMHILLDVWPKSLANLNINTNWTEALNLRFNNVFALDRIPEIILCKSEKSNKFLQILSCICYFLFNNNIQDYLTPIKSITYSISKEFLNESYSNWFSISSSSPFPLSELKSTATTTELDLSCTDTHLYESLREAVSKGYSVILTHLDTFIDPVLDPLIEFASVLKNQKSARTPVQLAGRTLVPNRKFQLIFSTNTPSFCHPSIYSNDINHLNMVPSYTMCYEICMHILLTDHYLNKSWRDLFAFLAEKELKFQSVQHDLTEILAKLFRCDITTGTSYIPQSTEIPSKVYELSQQLVIALNLRPYVQKVREYTEESLRYVCTQIDSIPDILANLACALSCIQEMNAFYSFNVNSLYSIMKSLFLESGLSQIQPLNISQKPTFEISDYLSGKLKSKGQENLTEEYVTNLSWLDKAKVDEENNSNLSDGIDSVINALIMKFVKRSVELYLPFLTRQDQFTFLLLSSLIANLSGVPEEYTNSLIHSVIQITSNSPLQPKSTISKVPKPEWVDDTKWASLLQSPLNEHCITTLYSSFTDQHTEWKSWISSSVPSYKNMPIPISMVGENSHNSILCTEALVILHIFVPLSNVGIFKDFISDILGPELLLLQTYPLSYFLSTDVGINPSKLNFIYFVMEKGCKSAIAKSLTLQHELVSIYTAQSMEIKSFSHLELSASLPNFDDVNSTQILLFKDFHLVKKGSRESFFSKVFSLKHKPITLVLYGEWCEDFPESLPEVVTIFPLENIEFKLFSNLPSTEQSYPSTYHVFDCLYNSIPVETRMKIHNHTCEYICYLAILFHCSLVTKKNCFYQSSLNNITTDLLFTALEGILSLKQSEDSVAPKEQDLFTILSAVYSLKPESQDPNFDFFSETVLGVSHEMIDHFLHLEKSSTILPTPSYFSVLSTLLKTKLSVSSDISPHFSSTLPLQCFPEIKFLPFNPSTLLEVLEKIIKILTCIPRGLHVGVPDNSPIFHYVITNELIEVHSIMLDVLDKSLSLQHYLKTGVVLMPTSLITIGEYFSKQTVWDKWIEVYNPLGTQTELFLWLDQLIGHFNQLNHWLLSPMETSSALDLSILMRSSHLISSLRKESQFHDSSENIISLWLPVEQFKAPVEKEFILNFKGSINTFTKEILLTRISLDSKILSIISIPVHVYNSLCSDGKDQVFSLKLNSRSILLVHCPSYILTELT